VPSTPFSVPQYIFTYIEPGSSKICVQLKFLYFQICYLKKLAHFYPSATLTASTVPLVLAPVVCTDALAVNNPGTMINGLQNTVHTISVGIGL